VLRDELELTAAAAAAHAGEGEEVVGVIPTEPHPDVRVYLCAFARGDDRSWLALDGAGAAIGDRALVRDAASIAALCELAEESAGGGKLEELRSQLVAIRLTEAPEGIEDAEDAALELERTIEPPPRVASAAYLDAIGVAARRLDRALGGEAASPFVEAMKGAAGVVDQLRQEIESAYKAPLG
jgi:hypothetical protein